VKRPWRLAWVAWLVAFLLVEIPAAIRKAANDTLSENAWDWFGVKRRVPYGNARRAALGLFLAVLWGHLVFGWPGGLGIILAALPVAAVIAYAVVRE
jgi:hypothetical protein